MKAGKLLEGADVKLRLYAIDGGETKLAAELKVPYQAVKNVKQERSVHRHADGTEHLHGDDSGVRGLYVAQLSFARAGDWGVELLVSQANAAFEPVRLAVTVEEAAATPAVGSAAPRSRNIIARDVKDLRQIDTSPKPMLDYIKFGLLTRSRKEAAAHRVCHAAILHQPHVRAGRRYRADIAANLRQASGLHAPGNLAGLRREKNVSDGEEWRLDTEPWVFVVDGKGIIRAKFEGLVTERELEVALQQYSRGSPPVARGGRGPDSLENKESTIGETRFSEESSSEVC